jgi:hypothetical protein
MLAVSDSVRPDSPLAGLVRASLTSSGQSARTTQASYQIIAPQAQAGVNVGTTASAAPSRSETPALENPAAVPIILGSILMLALVGVGLVLGLDLRPRRGHGRGRPWSARTGPWRPVATFAPPIMATGSPVASAATATTSAPPAEPDGAKAVDPPAGMVAADVGPDRPSPAEAEVPEGPKPISLAWTDLPDVTPPTGHPAA